MIYCWIYILINAVSALLRQLGGQHFSPAFILLAGSIAAILYFHLINLKTIPYIYKQSLAQKSNWFWLNVSIAITWLCAIYSPAYIGASLYTFIYFAVLGIIGSIFFIYQKKYYNFSQLISLLGLLSLLCYAIYKNDINISAYQTIGISLALIGGISGFIYSKQSANFMKTAILSTSQILAVRFFLIIPLCFILIPYPLIMNMSFLHLNYAMFIGIFCLIIPIYFSQKGIEEAGPEINAMLSSGTPLLCATLEQLYFKNLHWQQFLIYILYSIFAVIPYINKTLKKLF
jgi:hypothetical protein